MQLEFNKIKQNQIRLNGIKLKQTRVKKKTTEKQGNLDRSTRGITIDVCYDE